MKLGIIRGYDETAFKYVKDFYVDNGLAYISCTSFISFNIDN